MSQLCTHDLCTGCAACANICPKRCIHMKANEEGFLYPQIDIDACIGCGLCERSCPVNAENPVASLKQAYAANHRDPDIRQRSSSGGVFTAIAEYVIQQNGVVFGVRLDETMGVVHGYTDTVEGLSAFRGSKYVQSEIGDTYRQAEDFLKKGRFVLFSGTPCQIGGLLSYLGKPYENLLCQDIICHGVPSPMAWEKYLKDQEQEYGGIPNSALFRDKTYGWNNFSMKVQFANQKTYLQPMEQDSFMKAFLGNYCLRNSCYQCDFKQEARQADITLADFWGIDSVVPEMNDNKGTSLVLIHTKKGQAMFEMVSNMLESVPVDWLQSTELNSAMRLSVTRPAKRDKFMEALHKMRFTQAVKYYCRPSVFSMFKSFIVDMRYLPNRILRSVLGAEKYEHLKRAIRKL